MQMVMAYAAVANGGFLMRPYVIRRVVSPKGEVLLENQPHVVRRVISEKTSKLLASMLRDVTNEGGTGTMANVEGFEVAGKTGTAQKADPVHGGYSQKARRIVRRFRSRQRSAAGGIGADRRARSASLRRRGRGAGVSQHRARSLAPLGRGAGKGHAGVGDGEANGLDDAAPVKQIDANAPGAHRCRCGARFCRSQLCARRWRRRRSLNVKVRLQGNGYVIKQAPAAGSRWSEEQT